MLPAVLLALSAVSASDPVPAGTQLHYRGHFVAEKGELADSEKQFDLWYLPGSAGDGGLSAWWLVEERGRGGWSWLNRFGKWELNPQLRHQGGVRPTLSYERAEGTSVIPFQSPFLTYSEPLQPGVAWFEGPLEFRVAAAEKARDTPCWRIEARSPVGRKRTIWVDQASPLIMAQVETVFIGQGEQHELKYELVSREVLSPDANTGAVAAFAEFERVRTRLGLEPQVRETRWTEERLAILKADLPQLLEKSQGTMLAKLGQAATQDARNQRERAGALGALQNRLVGQDAPRPNFETLAGGRFSWNDLQGKVAVFHFWDYRDAPLEEPYGQVAYLDFLARQFPAAKVAVLGIVCDERVAQPDTKRAGVQSAKRLQSFMNLSYPLLVDHTEGIKHFGDPRATGAKLPLFVVLDAKGKIVHYHPGYYEVHRDRGLEELHNVVRKTLGE